MLYFVFILLFLSACGRSGSLSLMMDKIDARYLASTHVGTPDPRQVNPPHGQRIIINWFLPAKIMEKGVHINLHILFWNNTAEVVTYPLKTQRGSQQYFLLDEEFERKKGILTYKAEIITADGELYSEWKHQMWVNLILVEDEVPLPPEENPSSRLDPIEEIYEEEEMSDDFFYPPPDSMIREELPPVQQGEISPQQHQMDEQS